MEGYPFGREFFRNTPKLFNVLTRSPLRFLPNTFSKPESVFSSAQFKKKPFSQIYSFAIDLI